MRFRHLMIVNAAVAVACGLWFSLWPGTAATAYGVPWEAEPTYPVLAMVRLLGVALVAFGLVCWVFRAAAEELPRRVAGTLLGFFALASLLIWGQQDAIWDYSPAGWLTLTLFALDGLAFGAVLLLGLRAGGARHHTAAIPPKE